MRVNDLTVEVRDRNLNRVGVILPSDLNLTAKLPWAGVGEWELTLPQEHEMVQYLSQPGSGIVVTGPTGPGTVGPIFSGPRLPATRKRDQKDPNGTLRFSGVTDEVLLEDSLAYPQPTNADPATQLAANDTRTGYTESLMRQYVAYNVCYTHAPSGRLVGLRTKMSLGGADQSRGVVTAKSPRFQNLLELLQELAIEGTLGFRVIQVGSELQFQVVPVRDLRATIRLDLENGTIVSEEVQDSGPSLTLALVAGQGEGTDRTIITRARAEQTTEESQWGRRIERFFDRRDTDNVLELQMKGDEELANTGPGVAIKLVPSDDQTMKYLVDWNVGDWITAVVNDQETWSVVTEAVIQATPSFTGVGVSIGDVTSFTPEGQAKSRANKNDSRISYLERASAGPVENSRLPSRLQEWATDLAGSDLNSIVFSGWYVQKSNANATLARNYPVASVAGYLEVVSSSAASGTGVGVMQRYTEAQPGTYPRVWVRTYYSSWSAWRLTTPVDPPKRVEKRRVSLTVTGSESNAGVIWYRDYAWVNFLSPFPAAPLFEVSAIIDWGAVQHIQVFNVTNTGFQARGTRLYASGVANATVTYTATEA